MQKMKLPEYLCIAMNLLEKNGYEAYVVGGAVRDYLLDKEPKDYDLTTNATPEETQQVFADYHCILNGLKHGTVSVVILKQTVEITTYRSESVYLDHRHPSEVKFEKELKKDVLRRDFTINALAYNPSVGIVDYVGGREDLKNGVIRAIGEADMRFEEDALRILRALRFSATLSFEIEEKTETSMFRKMHLLEEIAQERKTDEFSKLLVQRDAILILKRYHPIFSYVLDEHMNEAFLPLDLFEEGEELLLRLFLLMQICGVEEKGKLARKMKYPSRFVKKLSSLSKGFALDFSNKWNLINALNDYGLESVKLACKAQRTLNRIGEKEKEKRIAEAEYICEKEVYSLKQLDIRGSDLEGVPKEKIGQILNQLLYCVTIENLENRKEVLISKAKELLN